MAKTKRQNVELPLRELTNKFPNVKTQISKSSDGQRTYICDIKLPSEFDFVRKVMNASGEVTLICFKKGSKTYTFCK